MSMTMELKCCPFCGGEAESDSLRGYRNISTGNPENAAAIYCTKCSADMTWCYRDTPEIERDHVMKLLIEQWNTRATASLQGEDAVERVARIVEPRPFEDDYPPGSMSAFNAQGRKERAYELARAILATGLVADEAAIRADERKRLLNAVTDKLKDETSERYAKGWNNALIAVCGTIRSGGGE